LNEVGVNYGNALEHALTTVPWARQFQELFPGALNGFTYYTGTSGDPRLYCQTALYDRYEFKMEVKIRFDKSRRKVEGYGEPTFHLSELGRITHTEGGGSYIEMGELQRDFGPQEWQRLYEARGDFSVLGIELVKNRPVPNFRERWEAERQKND